MNIKLCPIKIFKFNLYLILFLLTAHVLGLMFKLYFNDNYFYGFVPLFDLNHERNIPTFYSTFALIAASILLFFITCACKSLKLSYAYWLGLSLIFLFLSIDEMCSLHEQLSPIFRKLFNTSGIFYHAWVIPYGIALFSLIVIYLRFLFHLPKSIMFLFLFSGIIFVIGAVGFEMLGGMQKQLFGVDDISYVFYYTFEELFEMVGIAIFNYALLLYIVDHFDLITIETKENKREK